MVWPDGERLRRWRERRELRRESARIIKARGEIPELELKLARKRELLGTVETKKAIERKITETERAREIIQLRREAEELKELAEIEKTKRKIVGARRVLRPQRYGTVSRVFGGLGQIGERGQRMLGTPTAAQPRPLIGPGSIPSAKPFVGFGRVPQMKIKPAKFQAPRKIIPAVSIPRQPLISFWPQAPKKRRR